MIAKEKLEGPFSMIMFLFLGILLDTTELEANLSSSHAEKLSAVQTALSRWLDKVACTKRESCNPSLASILVLCGKLLGDASGFPQAFKNLMLLPRLV